jgi:hypothetical protein
MQRSNGVEGHSACDPALRGGGWPRTGAGSLLPASGIALAWAGKASRTSRGLRSPMQGPVETHEDCLASVRTRGEVSSSGAGKPCALRAVGPSAGGRIPGAGKRP